MSATPPSTPPDAKTTPTPTPTPGPAPAPAKAGSSLPLTIGIVVIALAAGVAAGTLALGPQLARAKSTAPVATAKKPKGEGHGVEGKSEKAAVYHIENLIVNPLGCEGTHFLMATVAIQLDDPKLEEVLRAKDDQLRDRVISVLEKRSIEELSVPGARDSLRVTLAQSLTPLIGPTDAAHVFLPNFVIQ